MLQGPAQKVLSPCQLDDICDHRVVSRQHEIAMAHEGEVLYDPAPALRLSEAAPVIGVKKPIVVGHLEVLTEQPEHLRLCPEGIVAYDDRSARLLDVHLLLGIHFT